MESPIQVHSHVGSDGTLYLEGLHDIADKDVTVILSPVIMQEEAVAFDIERYRTCKTGTAVKNRLRAFSNTFAKLPVLDDRSPDEIIGYDEFGLPS